MPTWRIEGATESKRMTTEPHESGAGTVTTIEYEDGSVIRVIALPGQQMRVETENCAIEPDVDAFVIRVVRH